MANDSNALEGEERIKIKKNVIITVGLFSVYLVLFAFNLQQFEKNFEIAQAGGNPDTPHLGSFENCEYSTNQSRCSELRSPSNADFDIHDHFADLTEQTE